MFWCSSPACIYCNADWNTFHNDRERDEHVHACVRIHHGLVVELRRQVDALTESS